MGGTPLGSHERLCYLPLVIPTDVPCIFGPMTYLEWGLHLGPCLRKINVLPRGLLEIMTVHLNLGANGE